VFAFAGAYRWTIVPFIAGAAVVGAAVRPAVFRPADRALDLALVTCLVITAAQLIPVGAETRASLSPSAATVERALLFDGASESPRALTLDPLSTRWALAFGAALLVYFWSARTIFARGGGLRVVARGIAWLGLALAAVMFVQRTATPGLIYGFWQPITRTPHPTPLGPFVNRNDIATWLLLACPLAFGYAAARLHSRRPVSISAGEIAALADSRMIWVASAVCLMMAALLASLSRSGLFGGAMAMLVFALLARRRLSARGLGRGLVVMAALVALASTYANVSALLQRINSTLPSNLGGRVTVWSETWPMVRDFPLTGIGVGAFERGMIVYQQSTRLIFFNHAHNEYLQLLVEGGLLLIVPAAGVLLAAWWIIRRRLAEDLTAVFWIRVGAVSGMAGVAAQSIWDTGLRMPANAALFALLLAAALHAPAPPPDVMDGDGRRTASQRS
jgi:O-antigen ligase